MSKDHNDSEYDLAVQASRDFAESDKRTREQKAWDAERLNAEQLAQRIHSMTCRPWLGEILPVGSAHNRTSLSPKQAPNYLDTVRSLHAQLGKALDRLALDGVRPGSSAATRIEAPKPIDAQPVSHGERVIKLGKIGSAA